MIPRGSIQEHRPDRSHRLSVQKFLRMLSQRRNSVRCVCPVVFIEWKNMLVAIPIMVAVGFARRSIKATPRERNRACQMVFKAVHAFSPTLLFRRDNIYPVIVVPRIPIFLVVASSANACVCMYVQPLLITRIPQRTHFWIYMTLCFDGQNFYRNYVPICDMPTLRQNKLLNNTFEFRMFFSVFRNASSFCLVHCRRVR